MTAIRIIGETFVAQGIVGAATGYAPLTTSLLLDGAAWGREQVVYGVVAALKPQRTDPFSWSIWWKTTTASNDRAFSQITASTGWAIGMRASVGEVHIIGPRGSVAPLDVYTAIAGGAPDVKDGAWHMITVVTEGNSPLTPADIHIYIDGVEMTGAKKTGSGSVGTTTVHASSQLYIGGEFGQGAEWPGNLLHASAWDFALTAVQVTELYGDGVPQDLDSMSFASPVFWDTLGDGDALGVGNMIDLGTGGNDGTADIGVDAGDFVADVPVGSAVWPIRLPGWMRLDGDEPEGLDELVVKVGARVAIAAAAVAPDGLLRATMIWRPAHDDSVDDTLLWLGTATLTYDSGLQAILWTVDDGVINAETLQSSTLTFGAGDTIEVEIEHNDNRRRITVNGVAVTADPLPPLVLPSEGYVLSGADGSAYGGELVSFVPHLQTFAELADERCLVQMSDNFRSWMQAMVADKARTFDALLGIRAAFDVEQAVGIQLDVIGSIVGLPREGFDDDRYSVFLGIQIELLLAAAREDGEWTGTCENVLRIVRSFLGASAPAIAYRNSPPYSYTLTIDLDLDEAFLLVRFLRTATHAGVLGLIVITLADDSLWDHDTVSVPDAGLWDHDTVAIPGAMTWGVAATTE